MKKLTTIAIGVTMLFAGVTFAADTAHTRMMEIKNSIPVLQNIPVTVVNDGSNELFRGNRGFAAGTYRIDSKRIFIANMFWTKTKHVMLHEAGHYAWYNLMSDSQRLNYCRVFGNEGKTVSQYSKTDCEENFAETFAYANGSRESMYSNLDEYMADSAQLRIVNAVIREILATQDEN